MKFLLLFVGITSAWATHGDQPHICEEVDQNGVSTPSCCEGWTGYAEGCLTPVCVGNCTLQGGTCISPNTCRCPGGRVAEDCSRSKCEEERHSHDMLSWVEKRRTFKPSCLPDGSYTILQCNKITSNCFCVDRWTGEMIVSTLTRGVPDCEEYSAVSEEKTLFRLKEVVPLYSNEQVTVAQKTLEGEEIVPPCIVAHQEWEEWRERLSFFFREPQCTEDGFFVSHRCGFGYCICIDRNTGEEIESTKVHSQNIDCAGVSLPEPEPEPTSMFPEEGCVVGTTYYSPSQSFFRDCNMCTCHGYNVIQCTDRTCEQNACYLGETGKIIEQVINGECYRCTCNNGVTDCSVVDCSEFENVEEVETLPTCDKRPAKTHFYDECNICWCNTDLPMCTRVGCSTEPGTCWVERRSLNNGQVLFRGCDTLRCVDGQVETLESCVDFIDSEMRFSASTHPEDACYYDDKKFFNGESMLYGPKICKCRNFDWDCQPMVDTMQ